MSEQEQVAQPQESKPTNIYQKMLLVMSEVRHVPKRGRNQYHGYDYATEADIVDHVRDLMAKARLIMLPMIIESTEESSISTKQGTQRLIRVTINFRLADVDTGEVIGSSIIAEGCDSGDKALYKAYAAATKYWLMKLFLVPTGDDPEQDQSPAPRQAQPDQAAAPQPAKTNQPTQSRQANQPTQSRPQSGKPAQPRQASQPVQRPAAPTQQQSNKQPQRPAAPQPTNASQARRQSTDELFDN